MRPADRHTHTKHTTNKHNSHNNNQPTNNSPSASGSIPRFYLDSSLVSRRGLSLNDRVVTPFGAGFLVEKRVHDLVVQPHSSAWELAYRQRPTMYLHPSMVKKDPLSEAPVRGADEVGTVYGPGRVLSRRPDGGQYVVESTEWRLAAGCLPRFYLGASDVRRIDDFAVGENITCVYGKGKVVARRASDYEVQLHEGVWMLAYEQRPRLFLAPNMLKRDGAFAAPVGGETVTTSYGECIVLSRRPGADGQYIVTPTEWKLANGSVPCLFLDAADVKAVDPKQVKTSRLYNTQYNEVYVTSVHEGKVIGRPKDWALANHSLPTYYLNPSAVYEPVAQ